MTRAAPCLPAATVGRLLPRHVLVAVPGRLVAHILASGRGRRFTASGRLRPGWRTVCGQAGRYRDPGDLSDLGLRMCRRCVRTLPPLPDPPTGREVALVEQATRRASHRPHLSPHQLDILNFERLRWTHPGSKEQAIRNRFGPPVTRYYQELAVVLAHPAALAYDAQLVRRVQRRRDQARLTGRRVAV